jgi:CheY-like chemotaxis protein
MAQAGISSARGRRPQMLDTVRRIHDLDVTALPVVAGTTVLVVDDDDALRQILALRFRLLGHDVETAASVPAAIAALEARGIGAVVSDYSMPEATGLDLLAYVTHRRQAIPFVLMTGQLTDELERLALAGGAAIALEKRDLLDALPDLFFFTGASPPDSQEIQREQVAVHRRLTGTAARLAS